MFPPTSPVVELAIVHKSIIDGVVPAAHHLHATHHWRWWRVRTSEPMIVTLAVHDQASVSGYHSPSMTVHGNQNARSSPTVGHHWHVAPLPRYRMATSNMTSNELVTTPGSLDHLDGFAVCKPAIAHRASVWRRDQRLISLAIRAVGKVGEKAAGLAHGDPRVATGGRVVQRTATHVELWVMRLVVMVWGAMMRDRCCTAVQVLSRPRKAMDLICTIYGISRC